MNVVAVDASGRALSSADGRWLIGECNHVKECWNSYAMSRLVALLLLEQKSCFAYTKTGRGELRIGIDEQAFDTRSMHMCDVICLAVCNGA